MPNPLRLAVIARHDFDDVRLPFPPAWLQHLGLAVGAPLGRLLGYCATYEPAVPRRRPRSKSVPMWRCARRAVIRLLVRLVRPGSPAQASRLEWRT